MYKQNHSTILCDNPMHHVQTYARAVQKKKQTQISKKADSRFKDCEDEERHKEEANRDKRCNFIITVLSWNCCFWLQAMLT